MAFLYNKLSRRILLLLILFWGSGSFFIVTPIFFARVVFLVLSIFVFISIIAEIVPNIILIFLSFTTSYALYNAFLQFNLPLWLLMVAILVFFGYIFTYAEQKTGLLGDKRLIYLILFALIILEIFLALSYIPINPLSRSIIIASFYYIISGYCLSVLAKRENSNFRTYLLWTTIIITLILFSSHWQI